MRAEKKMGTVLKRSLHAKYKATVWPAFELGDSVLQGDQVTHICETHKSFALNQNRQSFRVRGPSNRTTQIE